MIEFLLELDRELFLALNGAHAEWLNPIMSILSERVVWFPLYAFLLWLIWKDHGRKMWIYVLGIALTIIIADQVTSSVMKPYFERLRPSHDSELTELIHIVEGKGSKYGFASSHAANTFAVATYFFLLMRNRRRWIVWLFAWTVIVSYSRIYLGVHYPGDVVVGWLVGWLAAFSCFKLAVAVDRRLEHKMT